MLLYLWTENESCLKSSHSQKERADNNCNKYIVKPIRENNFIVRNKDKMEGREEKCIQDVVGMPMEEQAGVELDNKKLAERILKKSL